jgi:hypothetical protein
MAASQPMTSLHEPPETAAFLKQLLNHGKDHRG